MDWRFGRVAALLLCSVGCSSTYMPRPGPRLSVVMDEGRLAYVRDGKKFEGGWLGGDIEGAVQGNPVAEEYARDFKSGMVAGFATTMVASALVVAGAVVTGVEEGPSTGRATVPVTGLAMMGAGLVVDLIGLVLVARATPHLWDAVNAYNDRAGAAGESP
jgi:hypothetical protein